MIPLGWFDILSISFGWFALIDCASGVVLGSEGPEASEPGTSGSSPCGHRVCGERRSVSSDSKLQEESQFQHSGEVV